MRGCLSVKHDRVGVGKNVSRPSSKEEHLAFSFPVSEPGVRGIAGNFFELQ